MTYYFDPVSPYSHPHSLPFYSWVIPEKINTPLKEGLKSIKNLVKCIKVFEGKRGINSHFPCGRKVDVFWNGPINFAAKQFEPFGDRHFEKYWSLTKYVAANFSPQIIFLIFNVYVSNVRHYTFMVEKNCYTVA